MSINDRTGGHHETWIDDPRRPCATKDPELWFDPAADRYSRRVKKSDTWAKELCGGCPRINECLGMALTFDQADDISGVYGGTTSDQRADMRTEIMRRMVGGADAA